MALWWCRELFLGQGIALCIYKMRSRSLGLLLSQVLDCLRWMGRRLCRKLLLKLETFHNGLLPWQKHPQQAPPSMSEDGRYRSKGADVEPASHCTSTITPLSRRDFTTASQATPSQAIAITPSQGNFGIATFELARLRLALWLSYRLSTASRLFFSFPASAAHEALPRGRICRRQSLASPKIAAGGRRIIRRNDPIVHKRRLKLGERHSGIRSAICVQL